MNKIFFHADDFGVTLQQSKSILDCYENGVLNSVSIIPNSPETAASYSLIKDAVEHGKIRLVIHLNFVEGHCMADPACVPHLIKEDSLLSCSYGSMLKYNFSPKRSILTKEFEYEIAAQIASIVTLTGNKTINVDSHQHYLQIPMIFEAFCNVVKANGYKVNYLRIPVDPLWPIWSTPSKFFKVPLINHVKWTLLKILKPSPSKLSDLNCTIPIFFGMPFTCSMTLDNVLPLLEKYKKIAQKHNADLELMFHPGAVDAASDLLDASQADLVDFYSNKYRALEHKCLKEIN